jgi:hypothetical protein
MHKHRFGLPALGIRNRPRATQDTCFSDRDDRRRLGAAAPRHWDERVNGHGLARLDGRKGMGGGVSFSDLGLFLVMWTGMMAAMMFAVRHADDPDVRYHSGSPRSECCRPAWIFVAGYTFVWTYAGLVVYVLVHTVMM